MEAKKISENTTERLSNHSLENVVEKLSAARDELWFIMTMKDDPLYLFQKANSKYPITTNANEVKRYLQIMQDLSKAFVKSGADKIAISRKLLDSSDQSVYERAGEIEGRVFSENDENKVARLLDALGIQMTVEDIVEAETRIANKSESQLSELAESYISTALKAHRDIENLSDDLDRSKHALKKSLEKKSELGFKEIQR